MIGPSSTLVDVAFAICTALDRAGVRAVLVGGSAATFYAGAYQSYDIDFVLTSNPLGAKTREAVEALGFRLDGSHYTLIPTWNTRSIFWAGRPASGTKS